MWLQLIAMMKWLVNLCTSLSGKMNLSSLDENTFPQHDPNMVPLLLSSKTTFITFNYCYTSFALCFLWVCLFNVLDNLFTAGFLGHDLWVVFKGWWPFLQKTTWCWLPWCNVSSLVAFLKNLLNICSIVPKQQKYNQAVKVYVSKANLIYKFYRVKKQNKPSYISH